MIEVLSERIDPDIEPLTSTTIANSMPPRLGSEVAAAFTISGIELMPIKRRNAVGEFALASPVRTPSLISNE